MSKMKNKSIKNGANFVCNMFGTKLNWAKEEDGCPHKSEKQQKNRSTIHFKRLKLLLQNTQDKEYIQYMHILIAKIRKINSETNSDSDNPPLYL